MPVRDFVRRLHPGQVAILGLIAALALGLLLQTRQHATVEKQRNESLAQDNQHDIDSLERQINEAKVWLSMIPPEARFNARLFAMREGIALSNGDTIGPGYARKAAKSRYSIAVANRNADADRIVTFDLIIAAIVALSLGVAWVWFGGRQSAQVQHAHGSPSLNASHSVGSPTTGSGLNWGRLRAHPLIRLIGWLLLILLGALVFRIGEEVIVAIRSAR
jgi:hypothetical protein